MASFSAPGYVINNWWPDGDNIVMDEVFLPAATFSLPAQSQMTEWNTIDVTDNSHPFRINLNPQFSFGANDGDNTIGFLGEAALNSQYGLSYANALAWAVTWSNFFTGRINECDVMLDSTLPWNLAPDNNNWFQSTVLHELGHCRGLGHYNSWLSIENSGVSKYLRGETLFKDDKQGIRQHASAVNERDMVIYNKWHNGSTPQWMTMSPTTLREGQTVNLNNISVENRGNLSLASSVRLGIYLSTNDFISTGDQLLNTGSWSSFSAHGASLFNWSAVIPTVNDCGTRWIGGIIDDNAAWAERYENNNAVTFTNGVAYTGSTYTPTSLTILLAEDAYEPNDSTGAAPTISLPFSASNLSIDQDLESDYYRVVVPGSGTFSISATFSDSLGDINLRLLNSSGTTLASSLSTTNNESITYNVTSAAGGTYYIRVYGWGSGSCNKYSLTASFARPDLTTISPGVSDATLLTGQSFTASATARNQGAGYAASTTLRYYRSTNSIISTGDTQLTTDFVSALVAGGTSPETATVSAPATAGTYWIGACVDAIAGETNAFNQCSAAVQITVATPPDLVTINPGVSNTAPNPGASFIASADVVNQGGSPSASTTLRYYRSTDSIISTADAEIATDFVIGLAPSGTSAELAVVSAPTTPGTYWIGACVDAVADESPTNNQCSTGVAITVPVPIVSDKIGVWRNKLFFLDLNGNNVWEPGTDGLVSFGSSTDLPVVGDWNGDGVDDVGIRRGNLFFLDLNGNRIWEPGIDGIFAFGSSTDIPVIGDWNGDGTDDFGVRRNNLFFLDLNGNRVWEPGIDGIFAFGSSTDTPVIGDWNADGTDDFGIRRNNLLFLDLNGNRVWEPGIDGIFAFGSSTDTPVIGDWNADGTDDFGIRRNNLFYLDLNGNRVWEPGIDGVFAFGTSSDTPIAGKW